MNTRKYSTVLFALILMLIPSEIIPETYHGMNSYFYEVLGLNEVELDSIVAETPTLEQISIYRFMKMIAEIESDNTHDVVNKFGMMGKYQFSPTTIEFLGYDITPEEFLSNPSLQDSVMVSYLKFNNRILRRTINEYEGNFIDGVYITRAGILAAAHFAGPGGIKNYLLSSGNTTTVDSNGMTITKYMKMFSNYKMPSQINL